MPKRTYGIPGFTSRLAILVVALAAAGTASAQGTSRTRVRAVVLQRDAVFDSVESRFLPYRIANAVHAETRPNVIRRELLIDVGDPYDDALVAESERNLRALGIFRDVRIDRQETDSGVVLIVRTLDAWTTTIGVGAATSGSQSVIDLSLQELNLFGTRTLALLAYRNDPDRSSITLGFDTPRAIDNRIGVGATIVERSDGQSRTASLRLPFLSLSSRSGASLVASVVEGRNLQFRDGIVVDSLWREAALLRADAAYAVRAGPRGYLRIGLLAQALRDDIIALADRDQIPSTHTLLAGPYVSMRAPRYIRVRNVERIGRTEDVDLGRFASVSLLAVPKAWGAERNGIGGSLGASIGARIPTGFARFNVRGALLHTSEGRDTATAEGSATLVSQRGEHHLLVVHGSGGVQRSVIPGREYDIGLGAGLRAYPSHAFTGDRYFITAAEYRLLVWPRMYGLVGVGVAAFAGHAGAWSGGGVRRTGTEFGAGLRLASIREVGGIWRLDLSRRVAGSGFSGGWVASLGRGFVFGGI
jgi:hypothetical protein